MQDNGVFEPGPAWKSALLDFIGKPVPRILIQISLWLGSLFLVKAVLIKPTLSLFIADEEVRILFQGSLTLISAFALYYFLIRKLEKRAVTELALNHFVREAVSGLLLAFAMISLLVLVLWISGCYTFVSVNPLTVLLYPLVWVPLMASVEEIGFRGILFRIAEQAWGTNIALLLSAIIFGLMHAPNENANVPMILSATSGGLLMCMAYVLTKNLWFPIAFHAGWNFSQVIWGTAVSGTDILGMFITAEIDGPEWITGGAVGIEGSYFGIGLVIMASLVLYLIASKRGAVLA